MFVLVDATLLRLWFFFCKLALIFQTKHIHSQNDDRQRVVCVKYNTGRRRGGERHAGRDVVYWCGIKLQIFNDAYSRHAAISENRCLYQHTCRCIQIQRTDTNLVDFCNRTLCSGWVLIVGIGLWHVLHIAITISFPSYISHFSLFMHKTHNILLRIIQRK